jgi:hypothetical protein
MITFKTTQCADVTEIVCSAPAEKAPFALISRIKGEKWSVLNHRFRERKAFATLDEAKDFVHMRWMSEP